MDSKEAFDKIERKFTISNSIEVDRSIILRADWELAKQYMIEQASRQALEGEPVGTAKRCGYDRDITYCEFEADEVPIGTKLYTHPASADKQAVSVPDAWCVVTNDDQIQYTAMVDKNLGLPIEQSHDYAWQQCNEVIQEWIELGLDAASKYVIRPIALLATPTKADDWIKCSDRLPAEYDGDLEGLVWVNDRNMTLPKYAQSRVHWSRVRGIAGYTHWMPTGFRRPQPPNQEGQ